MVRFKWSVFLLIAIVFNSISPKVFGIELIGDEELIAGKPKILLVENFDNNQDNNFLQVDFKFPEVVMPGDVFTFESIIKKQSQHSTGGKFRFSWPDGFVPMLPESGKAVYKVIKNEMVVEWPAQSFPDDVSIAYPVQVNNVASGVYPVLTVLTVIGGLQIEKNTKIRVDVNKSGSFPQHTINATVGTFSLVLDYPREVVSGSQYDFAIKIRKNASTAKAVLKLSVPPFSDLQVVDYENYEYDKKSGKLTINWKNLPAVSEIDLTCRATSSGIPKAVYPLSAELFVDENLKAVFSNSIYITDKALATNSLTAEKSKKASPEAISDSLKLFAEMDELLNQWKNATKVVTVETGKPIVKDEPQQADLANKPNQIPLQEVKQNPADQQSAATKIIQPEPAPKMQENVLVTPEKVVEKKPATAVEKPVELRIDTIKTQDQNQETPKNLVNNQVADKTGNTGKELVQAEKPAPKETANDGNKTYKVQVGASKTHLMDIKQFVQSLGFYETVVEDFDGTWYRYFVGEFSQISEAKEFNKALIDKGMADSFVVTFVDGKRVPAN